MKPISSPLSPSSPSTEAQPLAATSAGASSTPTAAADIAGPSARRRRTAEGLMAPRSNVPGGMPPELLQHIAQALPTGRDRVVLAAASRETRAALTQERDQAQKDHDAMAEKVNKLPPPLQPGRIRGRPDNQQGEAFLMQLRRLQTEFASRGREIAGPSAQGLVRAIEALPEDLRPPSLTRELANLKEAVFGKSFATVTALNDAVARLQTGSYHGLLRDMPMPLGGEVLRRLVSPRGQLRASGGRYVEPAEVKQLRTSTEPHHIEAIRNFDALLRPPAVVERGPIHRPAARRLPPAGARPPAQEATPVQNVTETRVAEARGITSPGEQLLRNRLNVLAAAGLLQRDRNITLEQAERLVHLPPQTLHHLMTEGRTLRGAAQLNALAHVLEPGQVAELHTLVQHVHERLHEPAAETPPEAPNAPGPSRTGPAQDKGKRPESS